MATYLFTWNPDRWDWKDLSRLAARNIRGKKVQLNWSTGNRKTIEIGDRFFLLQQGSKGRGVIGTGTVISRVFQETHFDSTRQSDIANFAKLEFSRLVDPFAQPERRLELTELQRLSGDSSTWAIQSSGVEIPDELGDRIEDAWEARGVGYPDGVTRDDVLMAIAELRKGVSHNFADSVTYDVLFEGERFPPKAVAGLAGSRAAGRALGPYDFRAGEGSKFFKVLRALDFEIVPKIREEPTKSRNPKCTRDELILALELYLRVKPAQSGPDHPDIVALSHLLNELPLHPASNQGQTFRNPNGVYMKLSNFLRFDPSYSGAGLPRGNQLEEVVWNEFADDHERLRKTVDAIKNGYSSVPRPSSEVEQATEAEEEFPEGRVLTVLHKRRERSPKATRRKKEAVLRQFGQLECEVCDFNFAKTYGPLGSGFAECHHTKPICDLKESDATRLSDLAIVCSNCHRMLHRTRPLATISSLRQRVKDHADKLQLPLTAPLAPVS